MLTPWGEALDADHPLPEYPRPQLVRDSYLNLNGRWDHAFTPVDAPAPTRWDGSIVVPFSPEAPLSGVNRRLRVDEALWYRRDLTLPDGFDRGRVLLHFGAVDQDAEIFLDGRPVGSHRGGYLPFTIDVTAGMAGGSAELTVRVRDITDTGFRSRGKQALKPGGIWYTPQSGIWQSVWVESVPEAFVSDLILTPDFEAGSVAVTVVSDEDLAADVVVSADGVEVARGSTTPGEPLVLSLGDGPRPWSPEDPFLHDVEVRLGDDRVTGYFGLRSVEVGPDALGVTRLLLNGEPYLHAGLLDQGYWPDGLYTPPSDEAMIHDIATAKDLGFTMLRKHIKIEPLRWYHHCDRLGMLVWQDMVNGGRPYNPAVIQAPVALPMSLDDRRHTLFGRQDEPGRSEFLDEAHATVRLLRSSPPSPCGCRSTRAGASSTRSRSPTGSAHSTRPARSTTRAAGTTAERATSPAGTSTSAATGSPAATPPTRGPRP
ncbi:glycoside hydrolase family 2 protein [Tessaracoccus coleopterorum]|uniref:glycoside hydrolase family 2 protein n=1 Tax=Tessaracoccus coleopterorum TaxID=2714950 RepID=UPI0018D481EA|nr:sugar-binding domain-containing protein [Tessaracoccus coleopterorum]